MFRRVAVRAPSAAFTPSTQARTYFYAGGGELGIWKTSQIAMCRNIVILAILGPLYIYQAVFVNRGVYGRQFLGDVSDLYEDDGTVMDGEDAVANLRIYRERIMPHMEEFAEKIEAASA